MGRLDKLKTITSKQTNKHARCLLSFQFCFCQMWVKLRARTFRSAPKICASEDASLSCESRRRRTDGPSEKKIVHIGSIPCVASLPSVTPDLPLLRADLAAYCGRTTPWLCCGHGAAFFALKVIYFYLELWNKKWLKYPWRLVLVGHFRSPIDFKVSHAGDVF